MTPGNILILVPLDGSRFGEAAIPVALGLARLLGGRIELISVFEEEPLFAAWQLTAVEMRGLLSDYLQDLVDRIGKVSDIAVTSHVASGPVTKTLEDYATKVKPALVVMATHGRGPLSRAWLGSVADQLSRRVPVPVLLVRPEEGAEVELRSEHRFRQLLLPLDGSELAEQSLEWAKRMGQAAAAAYTLVRVVPPPMPFTSPYLPHAAAERREALESGQREAEEYLGQVAERLRREGLRVGTDVITGVMPASGIIRLAAQRDADLIVMTTHARSGIPRLVLGSVADKVVRGAEAPVLLIRPDA